jgi:hypothetical protein
VVWFFGGGSEAEGEGGHSRGPGCEALLGRESMGQLCETDCLARAGWWPPGRRSEAVWRPLARRRRPLCPTSGQHPHPPRARKAAPCAAPPNTAHPPHPPRTRQLRQPEEALHLRRRLLPLLHGEVRGAGQPVALQHVQLVVAPTVRIRDRQGQVVTALRWLHCGLSPRLVFSHACTACKPHKVKPVVRQST